MSKIFDFDACIDHVLKAEGGYSNHANDRGGPTNWGITQNVLKEWRRKPVTASDVRDLTLDEAKAIYRARYWNPMNLDKITQDARCLILFDQGVNRGTGTAMKQAQMVIVSKGITIKIDGVNGPITSGLINNMDYKSFCLSYLQFSQAAYVNICMNNKSQLVFLKGWLNRVNSLMEICWRSL